MVFDHLFSSPSESCTMDQIYFSPTSNGVPSESKLATYMNRGQNATSPLHQFGGGGLGGGSSSLGGLTSGMLRFNMDSPLTIRKAQVTPQSPEFIPAASRITSSPSHNFQWPLSSSSSSTSNGGLLHNNNTTNGTNHSSSSSSSSGNGLLHNNNSNNNGHIVKPNFVNPLKGMSIGTGSNSSSSNNSSSGTVGRRFNNRNLSPEDLTDSPQSSPPPPTNAVQMLQESVGGTTYFYPAPHGGGTGVGGGGGSTVDGTSDSMNAGADHLYQMPVHMYPGPAAHVLDPQPKSQLFNAFFMGEELRADLQTRNSIANGMDAVPEYLELPQELENYHALTPIEAMPANLKMPVVATMYRATHSGTGVKYCLRRIQVKSVSTKCMSIIEQWKKLQHSNIVQLREVFTTKACGDNSLILVYDYHAGSQTLLAKYFTPITDHMNGNGGGGGGSGGAGLGGNGTGGYTDPFGGEARPFSHKSSMARTMGSGPMLSENEIWSLIMQITAGLKAIHQAGLACRTLDPTKIILTGKRVRFSCLGVSDIVSFDPNQTNQLAVTNHFQQEDLTSLGKLVLALACRSLHAVHRDQMQASLDHVSRHYSNDLNNLIFYLFTNNVRSVSDLMPMIGARFYTQLDALQTQCDIYQDELAKDMENGRLYRLLVKLNFINERPEFNLDPSWSETGDRYMLKLFRDYLFHSVADDGRPWLDHAHIVQCLNRLDAGTMEKVQLMSRDEQSVLLVTYAELKHCLEQSFSELVAAS